MSFLKKCY